jgi:hypothetical protein
MAGSETFIFRASLAPDIYRALEIADSSTLHDLAAAIVASFDFDFDHAFGFYSRIKGNILASPVRYELFADQGREGGRVQGVKRTLVGEAFPTVGRRMSFIFDYGDEWVFLVEFVKRKPKEPRVKLPRLLVSAGKAPEQYPDLDDE